jgi:CubicO group peptidase (beta-lactamase class C family)
MPAAPWTSMIPLHELLSEPLPAIPSLSACVLRPGQPPALATVGWASLQPVRPAAPLQVYDLASLTKALVGSTVCASLVAHGALDPDAPVQEVLADVPPTITARHLLDHTAGYPAHVKLYERVQLPGTEQARRQILDEARAVPLVYEPGSASIYSDLGYLVLLDLVETLTGQPLDRLFASLIAGPAGVSGLRWGAPDAAATERCPVRGALVEGIVHDPNAWAMGGVSTHAGLFGSAYAVARLAAALLDPSPALRSTAAQLEAWWRVPSVGSHRGGWDTPSHSGYSSTGGALPAGAVGHLGYTGTSIWMVPREGVVIVLLTNRVHPTDELTAIRAFRPRFHQAVARQLGWTPP